MTWRSVTNPSWTSSKLTQNAQPWDFPGTWGFPRQCVSSIHTGGPTPSPPALLGEEPPWLHWSSGSHWCSEGAQGGGTLSLPRVQESQPGVHAGRVSTNLLVFLASLYVALLWALSEKSFPTFQEIPVVVHILRNVQRHLPGGFVEEFCKLYTVYLGKNQRENETLLFSCYRTLTLHTEINERPACGVGWYNQGVTVSEAGCSQGFDTSWLSDSVQSPHAGHEMVKEESSTVTGTARKGRVDYRKFDGFHVLP